jgi:RNA polymerase-binding transcription factor DksA
MAELEPRKISIALTAIGMKAYQERRGHDAFLHGVASYIVFRELKDDESEYVALASIKGAVDLLLPTDEGDQCSFCGRKPPEVRLAAGPSAFICDSCVATLSETFNRK